MQVYLYLERERDRHIITEMKWKIMKGAMVVVVAFYAYKPSSNPAEINRSYQVGKIDLNILVNI